MAKLSPARHTTCHLLDNLPSQPLDSCKKKPGLPNQ